VITWINGSSSPAEQPPQLSFQDHPERHRAKVVHPTTRGGLATPRGSDAPSNRHTGQNRRKEPTLNRLKARIRSVQVKRQWIIGLAAPLDLTAPMKMGPRAQPTSLTYKRSLTPARSNTQHWSISFPLFCSLRVGLV
jgi:hypothetical protein